MDDLDRPKTIFTRDPRGGFAAQEGREVLELLHEGGPRPAAIVGMPVGFVGSAESKEALAANPWKIPYAIVRGRRGGSALAAATINALAREAEVG